jgi:hypothetical protein
MAYFITYAFLVATMALSITAMPLGIFEDPCDGFTCQTGQHCMAPDDMPRCFPSGFPDNDPILTHDPCSRFTCPNDQRCLALDDMPRCYPILPTLDDPFPIHNPCAGVTCPKGQRCLAPNNMPRCFPQWPPPDDSGPFPFPIERKATVPDHIGSCPRDWVCPEGQFCLELNGTPKCITPKPVHSTFDPCRFKICDVDEFCEVVGLTAKCTPFSVFTPVGMPTATPTPTPASEV